MIPEKVAMSTVKGAARGIDRVLVGSENSKRRALKEQYLGKHVTRNFMLLGATAGVLAGLAHDGQFDGLEISAMVNMADAATELKSSVKTYTFESDLRVSTTSAETVATAEGIKVDWTIEVGAGFLKKDLGPTCTTNKQLDGLVEQQNFIPADAMKPVQVGDVLNVYVDGDSLEQTTNWYGTPLIREYALDGDAKDYDQKQGMCGNAMDALANVGGFIGPAPLEEAVNRTENAIDKEFAAKALNSYREVCGPKLNDFHVEAIESGVEEMALALGSDATTINVEITNDEDMLTWTPTEITSAQSIVDQENLIGDPKVEWNEWEFDQNSCDTSEMTVSRGEEG